MGSYASKLLSHHSEHEAKSKNLSQTNSCGVDKHKMCTPPMSKRKLAADPRSATMGIARTPIEIASTPPGLTRRVASALPKYLQGKRFLETDFDSITPFMTPVKCIPDPRSPNITEQRTPIVVKTVRHALSPVVVVNEVPDMETPEGRPIPAIDPRSPAVDFDRTPILKPKSIERTEENVAGTVESNVRPARLSYCETTTDYSIPEIQAVIESASGADESLSIQDRIDLCENRSDSILSRESSVADESVDTDLEEQVTVIRNPKILSPWSDALSTWAEDNAIRRAKEIGEKERDESAATALDNNISDMINAVMKAANGPSGDKIKIWRDSVSPNITEEAAHKNPEEIIIEFDDEIVPTPLKIVDVAKTPINADEDRTKSQTKKRKPPQFQLEVENKSKSDERKVFNNEGKTPLDGAKNRTPLANRSNHKQLQLVAAKSPQQILRNKGLSTRNIHQENTPPHNDRFVSKTKSNGTQWDPDTTVII